MNLCDITVVACHLLMVMTAREGRIIHAQRRL